MANNKKAAGKKPAAPKKVYYTSEAKAKYEVLGKNFRFKMEKFTAEEAVENKELMETLIKAESPSIKKV